MRSRLLLGLVSLLFPWAALANLTVYDVRASSIVANGSIDSINGVGTAVIEDQAGSNPVLKMLVQIVDPSTTTFDAPGLAGFIWLSNSGRSQGPAGELTGTGAVLGGQGSIEWGSSSWPNADETVFCHSVPSTICDLSQLSEDATLDRSTLFVFPLFMESWLFHGTGFVSEPFIFFTTFSGGNAQYGYRGVSAAPPPLPGLPLAGLAAVGVSVLAMGAGVLRRRG